MIAKVSQFSNRNTTYPVHFELDPEPLVQTGLFVLHVAEQSIETADQFVVEPTSLPLKYLLKVCPDLSHCQLHNLLVHVLSA